LNFGKLAKAYLSLNIPWDISAEEITQLYTSVREVVAEHYPSMKTWGLTPRLKKALLFCDEINVDDEVMDIISQGVFTNTLTNLKPNCTTTIFPRTTILGMDNMSISYTPGLVVPEQIRKIVDSLLMFVVSNDSQIGYPLEIVTNGIINARLLALTDIAPIQQTINFTISQLLLLRNPVTLRLLDQKEKKSITSTIKCLKCELKVINSDQRYLVDSTTLSKSYNEKYPSLEGLKYLKDANDIIYPDVNIVTKNLHPKEAHDGVWSFRTWLNDMIHTLMVDAKGVRELPVAASYPPLLDLKQAIYMQSFDKKIKKFVSKNQLNVNDDSMTQSLALNNTVFVYITTRREVSKISDRVLILGDTDTRNFLGFLEPLYAVCRTSSVVEVRDYISRIKNLRTMKRLCKPK